MRPALHCNFDRHRAYHEICDEAGRVAFPAAIFGQAPFAKEGLHESQAPSLQY